MMTTHVFIPGAELARELAVALVNTPRVFQVLVSVVPVREHLATTLTLEAVVTCLRQTAKTPTYYKVSN